MRFLCALILADVGGGGERTDRNRRFDGASFVRGQRGRQGARRRDAVAR
jgi:hypothetical protein